VFEIAGERLGFEQNVIKVGRGPKATLQIDDENVSRLHAVIECTPTEVLLIDLGTAIGTLVNGERASKWALKSGDVLRFGTTDVKIFI
jgi:pSer/pThr/pTyr-binding forkhead associated (FHA) protein